LTKHGSYHAVKSAIETFRFAVAFRSARRSLFVLDAKGFENGCLYSPPPSTRSFLTFLPVSRSTSARYSLNFSETVADDLSMISNE
jgi:hypothetical protein